MQYDTKKREKRRENKYNVNERQAQAKFKKAEPGAGKAEKGKPAGERAEKFFGFDEITEIEVQRRI